MLQAVHLAGKYHDFQDQIIAAGPEVLNSTNPERLRLAKLSEYASFQKAVDGVEVDRRYYHSPAIMRDGDGPAWVIDKYQPSTAPGSRIPHVWVDGKSTIDLKGLTLICFEPLDLPELKESFVSISNARGIPLEVMVIEDKHARSVFGNRDLVLVRPDAYSVWRSGTASNDVKEILDVVLGFKEAKSDSQEHTTDDLYAVLLETLKTFNIDDSEGGRMAGYDVAGFQVEME
jgi:FAD-dependent monooxygenase